jgi:predicted nucleic acid-binding protein
MIQTGASVVAPTGRLRLCRDVSDDVVLETALLRRAKYLVSRDADVIRDLALIRVFRERGVQIVTVGQVLQLMHRKP